MPTLPPAMLQLMLPFAPLFARRVWCHALVLVAGSLLAPGKRTVCAALRAMGLSQTKHWTRYHRVLNRAKWSSLAVARVLLDQLVAVFAPAGVLVVGLDETIERRHPQAGTRTADRRQGALSGCGPVEQGLFCQGQRPALALPDAAGADSLGGTHLGAALPDDPGSIRTARPGARAAA